MSAPVKPALTIVPWATGNYSAGANPWSGGAQRVAPPTPYFTPATNAAAEYVNYLHGVAGDNASALDAWSAAITRSLIESRAQRWASAVDPRASGYGTNLAAYNPFNGHWFVGVASSTSSTSTSTWDIWETANLGESWASHGGGMIIADGFSVLTAIGFHAGTGNGIANSPVGGPYTYQYNGAAGAWTYTTVGGVPNMSGYGVVLFLGTRAVLPYVETGTFKIATSTDYGTNWTSTSFGATSGGSSDTRGATNGTLLVVSPRAAGSYYTSTNGTTWTSRTAPDTGNLAGIDWDATAGLWVASYRSGTSGDSKVYTSPDAVTWTLASTLTSIYAADMACMFGTWFIPAYRTDGALGWGVQRTDSGKVAYSSDRGATWRVTSHTIAPAGTRSGGVVAAPTITKGVDRLLVSNAGTIRFSGSLESGPALVASIL